MTRRTLITVLLTLAFALAGTPAVLADSHEGQSFDPSSIEEWNQDEALILYQALENRLLAMGVAEEDLDAAIGYLGGELANLSEEDLEDLAEASAAMGLMDELTAEEEGEDVDMGDGEFGQDEEDEPELGDDEGDDGE